MLPGRAAHAKPPHVIQCPSPDGAPDGAEGARPGDILHAVIEALLAVAHSRMPTSCQPRFYAKATWLSAPAYALPFACFAAHVIRESLTQSTVAGLQAAESVAMPAPPAVDDHDHASPGRSGADEGDANFCGQEGAVFKRAPIQSGKARGR